MSDGESDDPGAQVPPREADVETLVARTMAVARETGARWPAELKTFDVDDWLYDENGLPRCDGSGPGGSALTR